MVTHFGFEKVSHLRRFRIFRIETQVQCDDDKKYVFFGIQGHVSFERSVNKCINYDYVKSNLF